MKLFKRLLPLLLLLAAFTSPLSFAARSGSSASDFLSNSSPGATGFQVSIACWFKNQALTTQQALISLGTSGGSNNNMITLNSTTTGQAQLDVHDGTAGNQATTTNTVSDHLWHLLVGVFTSATNYLAYLDGGTAGTQTVSRAPSAFNITRLMQYPAGNLPVVSSGEVAECAVWNMSLSSSDITNLMTTRPSGVQAANLVGYWPLNDNTSPEPDSGSGNHSLTVTGTSYVADDPYRSSLLLLQ